MSQTLNFQLQVIKWPHSLKLIDFDTCLPKLTIPYNTCNIFHPSFHVEKHRMIACGQ
jgi:hypothetical protein